MNGVHEREHEHANIYMNVVRDHERENANIYMNAVRDHERENANIYMIAVHSCMNAVNSCMKPKLDSSDHVIYLKFS